ncbi:MAG: hypothetical protein KME29_05080 [Calothrix sp. FI2-JRJ7]|jgi:hypothetical protein|nr:hypothetical protein [Calothrix sp. FI2-JRJ7]
MIANPEFAIKYARVYGAAPKDQETGRQEDKVETSSLSTFRPCPPCLSSSGAAGNYELSLFPISSYLFKYYH